MSTALYRRYRSATFGDLIGQAHMATTLRNQIREGNVAHAYLFAGMRGTGKTSTARILARAMNCESLAEGEPCNACTACIDITSGATVDVLEIDAASNRGIDEMRDLREKVKFLPAALRRKVYIIDEAHMLTTEAWNALLKTLEEPPDHVLFILATTEPHKIPETVRSRVQRFDFRRVSVSDVAAHLGNIAAKEGFTIDDDAASLLARASQGSVRDGLSMLEQSVGSSEGKVSLETVRLTLGFADSALMHDLTTGLVRGDAAAVLSSLDKAIDAGADPRQLLREVGRIARAAVLVAIGHRENGRDDAGTQATELAAAKPEARWWLAALEQIAKSELALRQPVEARLQVEQCLLHIACVDDTSSIAIAHTTATTAAPVAAPSFTPPVAAVPAAPTPQPQSAAEPETHKARDAAVGTPAPGHEHDGVVAGKLASVEAWNAAWPKLIEAVNRRKEVSLAGVLRDCRPVAFGEGQLTIGALGAFHLERLNDPLKVAILIQAASEISGESLTVSSVFIEKKEAAPDTGKDVTEAVLDAFSGSRMVSSRMKDRTR